MIRVAAALALCIRRDQRGRRGVRLLLAAVVALLAFRLVVALTNRQASDAMLQVSTRYVPAIVSYPMLFILIPWHWVLGWMGQWTLIPALAAAVTLVLAPTLHAFRALRDGELREFSAKTDSGWWRWFLAFALVVGLPLYMQSPRTLLSIPATAVGVWLVPCAVVGGFVPFLGRLSRSPGLWISTALMGAGLVLISIWLTGRPRGWLIAGLVLFAAGVVTLRRPGIESRVSEFWPLLPLSLTLWVIGCILFAQQFTFRLLGDLHTLMSLQPPPPREAIYLSRAVDPSLLAHGILAPNAKPPTLTEEIQSWQVKCADVQQRITAPTTQQAIRVVKEFVETSSHNLEQDSKECRHPRTNTPRSGSRIRTIIRRWSRASARCRPSAWK